MNLNIYAIFDLKAHCFLTPYFSISDGVAKRDFCDLVRDKRSSISRHPADYRLHRVGVFEQVSGHLIVSETKPLLCTGDEFVEPDINQLKLSPDEADVSMSAPA